MAQDLSSQQKKFLRSLAHPLKPLVLVGKNGLTEKVLSSVEAALARHELIKVKFLEHKEREAKLRIAETICRQLRCFRAGMIGHTAILFRQAAEPSRRKIKLP